MRVLSRFGKCLISCELCFGTKTGVTFGSFKYSLSPIQTASFARSDIVFHYIGDIRTSCLDYLNHLKG